MHNPKLPNIRMVLLPTVSDEGFDTTPGACSGLLIWSFGGCTVILLLAYQSQCPIQCKTY